MKGHGTKFNRKMEAAIAAILTHKNLEEAAGAAGVSVATLLRWQKLPEFQKEFRKAKRAVHAQAMARLQQATGPVSYTHLDVYKRQVTINPMYNSTLQGLMRSL